MLFSCAYAFYNQNYEDRSGWFSKAPTMYSAIQDIINSEEKQTGISTVKNPASRGEAFWYGLVTL